MTATKNARKLTTRGPGGPVTELEDIEILGDPANADRVPENELHLWDAMELPVQEIQGSRSANVRPFESGVRMPDGTESRRGPRRDDGVSRLVSDTVGEWVQPWMTEVIGQPVEGMGGTTDWEVPEWLGELVADSDGQMPTSMAGGAWEFAQNVIPGVAQGRQFAGTDPSREARTISPMSALAGAADAASFGAGDELSAIFGADPDEYRREMRTTQRQNPGSFALGEAGGVAAQMLVPGAAQGRGATTAARAGYAALEGAAYGGIEGMARSNAPTLMGRVEDAAMGAGAGGLLGGAFGAASGRFDSAATDAQRRLDAPTPSEQYGAENDASVAAWHQIGQFGADQSSARQKLAVGGRGPAIPEGRLDEMAVRTAQQMRDRGIIAQEGSLLPIPREESQTRARVMQEQAGRELQALIDSIADEPADVGRFAEAVGERARVFEGTPAFEAQAARLRTIERQIRGIPDELDTDDALEQFLRNGVVEETAPVRTIRDLQNWKTLYGQRERFPVDQQATRTDVYTDARDALQSEVERLLPGQADAYRDARQRAALGYQLRDVTAGDARREGRNNSIGLTTYIAGSGMASTAAALAANAAEQGMTLPALGTAAAAAAAMAANGAYKARQHGIAAGRLERAAMALRTNPARFGAWASRLQAAQKRGAQAFASALYIAQQNDAAVREAMAEEEDVAGMRERATEAVPTMDAAIEEDINSIPTMDDL